MSACFPCPKIRTWGTRETSRPPAQFSIDSLRRIGGRQREEEAAALAGSAFRPDASALLLDDATAESQAEAGAAQGASVGGVACWKRSKMCSNFSGEMPLP